MPEIKNSFIKGKMNKDLDDKILPNGEYRDAVNIKVSKSDNSDVGSAQNVKGNDYEYGVGKKITFTGDTIGKHVNKLTGDVFWFVTDFTGIDIDDPVSMETNGGFATSSNNCKIYHTKLGSGQEPKELINSFRLNFSKKHPILHSNIIDELLFWTDNYNQPRKINIRIAIDDREKDDAEKYYKNDKYLEDKISVAQYAPASAPKVRMSHDTSIKSKHIEDKFVKFAYRFQFDNNEYSIISPFTQTCFHPGKGKDFNFGEFQNTAKAGVLTSAEETDAVEQTIVKSVQNLANVVELFIDLPGMTLTDGITENNHAACSINKSGGESGGYPITIDGVNGTIANGNTVLTERGDNYTVDTSAGTLDSTNLPLSTSIDSKIPLIDNQRLYFFTNIADYVNNLKIKKIQILYSEAGSLALKVVDTIDFKKQVLNTSDNINNIIYRAEPISDNKAKLMYGFKFTYNSAKPILTLPESELIRISDIIPVKAKTQEVSGNRVIYGNFWQNRDITGINADDFNITSGDQDKLNSQYLLSSVKSNREYSVGIVLSDRYGRHSTVLTPTDNTEFLDPKSGSFASWNHYALKLNFNGVIGDAYSADTNPLGWHTYKIVVKQAEQEYHNVFAPTILDNIPADEKRSWLVLHGDNINKVPRDVTDTNTEDGTQGSQTSLLPKILDTNGSPTQQSGTEFIDIISIGTKNEHGIGTSIPDFYLNDKNPLLAELPDGSGRNHSQGTTFDNLIVLETKPVSSALDLYFETSTAGLVSHLNEQIDEGLTGSVPNAVALSANTVAESASSGTKVADLTTTDSSGSTISTPTYSIVSIFDGNGTDRAGAFVIDGEDLDTGETFEFKNNNQDTYSITIKSTKGSNSQNFPKTVTVSNVVPTQTVGSSLALAASTTVGTAVRTITAVNGSAKSGATANNLTFSIVSGNTDNDFSINSSTGVISVANSLTAGDSYTLGIRTTDVGGLQDNDNLSITISSSNFTSFYRSEGASSPIPDACDRAVGILAYHNGTDAVPVQGDTIFTDAQGTTPLAGGNADFAWSPGGGSHNGTGTSFKAPVNNSGVVGSVTLCS